ncbi:resolvase [Salmonella enterica subsp. enterica]|nr:resolvase [Salmonella enterica subsp. enterica]
MNYPSLPGQACAPEKVHLPVAIDYPAALALRQMAIVQDELPKYLLAPEVSALLHYVPDLHRKMLLATLWNTGARINEALALTRSDFSLAPPYPFVQLATLKQRAEKAARTAGRTPAGSQAHRRYRCQINSTSASWRLWWPR